MGGRTSQGQILIVEDDEGLLRDQAQFLRDQGFVVALAADRDEALTVIRTAPIDVMVADLDSRQRDALEVVFCVNAFGLAISMILMTAVLASERVRFASNCGAYCLLKPVETLTLLSVITDAIAPGVE